MDTCRALTTRSHLVLNLLANHYAFYFTSMQYTKSSPSPRWLFMEQWRHAIPAVSTPKSAEQPPTHDRPDAASHKPHAPSGVPKVPDMSISPPSNRASSPQYKSRKEDIGLMVLKKPIYHIPLNDDKKEQLPEEIRVLYNRLYDITVEQGGHCHSFGIDFTFNVLVSLLLMLFDLCPLPTLLFSSLPATFSKPTWN